LEVVFGVVDHVVRPSGRIAAASSEEAGVGSRRATWKGALRVK
jgi:hypothetical protein